MIRKPSSPLALAVASLILLLGSAVPTAQANETGTNLMIRSAPSNGRFCLDAQADRKADGTPVLIYQCHGRENQRWTVSRNTDGTSAIVGTGGLCLDVRGNGRGDGTPVQLWQCHFGANQRFRVLDDGRIQEVGTGKCLMVLPQWTGERERDHAREFDRDRDRDHDREHDDAGERRRAWERWHAHDDEHLQFVERDGAAVVIDDCDAKARQFWQTTH